MNRGRRGRIVGWQLHPETEKEHDQGECILSRQPVTIFVKFPGVTWRIKDLEEGVYPLTQASRTWLVNKKTQIQARRTGFFLIPDFAATAHMIQGQTLPAVFADTQALPETEEKEKRSDKIGQISAYISLSRVRMLNTIWVLQPFALSLFQQGPPPGPTVLLAYLLSKSKESVEEAFGRYAAATEEFAKRKGGVMKDLYECKQCKLEGRGYELAPTALGADEPSHIVDKILREGSWARCLACQEVARARRAALGKPASPALVHGFAGGDDATCEEPVFLCGICETTKRAARFPLSMMKNKDRNKVLACNACVSRRCRTCGETISTAEARAQKDMAVDTWTCKGCSAIKCKHCKEPVPQATWGSIAVDNHKNRGDGLTCEACKGFGRTSADGKTYACDICKSQRGRTRFEEKQVSNYNGRAAKQTKKPPLRCLECEKTHARCHVCEKWRKTDEHGWAEAQLKDSRKTKDPRPLVCAGCVDRGYTPKDLGTYKCQGCDVQQGRHKFDKKDMDNKQQHEKHKKKFTLFCPLCKEREERLLTKVQSKSAWHCTCGERLLRHLSRTCLPSCKLYPNRCRACNLGVRADDIEFLARRESNKFWLA